MTDVIASNSVANGAESTVASDGTTDQQPRRTGIRVTISKDKLHAMLVLKKPGADESPYVRSDIDAALANAGVVYGISEKAIEHLLAKAQYDVPVRVASGDPPQRGIDATIEYLFEIEPELAPQEAEDGTIDYRSMNFIQNITTGAVLAKKHLPGPGLPGKAVDGSELAAPHGRDRELTRGENTEVSEDGLELKATVDGAIVYRRGQVSVQDVLVINGNVDFSVGNLTSVGSVTVRGDVCAGFSISCGGNLEVSGNVEDASIDVKGNILIRGGCYGKGKGSMLIQAEGSVYLKYAEGQNIRAGENVVVANELINCDVEARGNVTIEDSRGKIIGGRIEAGKEIRAAVFGSEAGTKTVLMTAQNKELVEEYRGLTKEIERITNDRERIQGILIGLRKLEIDNKLPPDKAEALEKLEEFNAAAPKELERCQARMAEINEKMKELRDARIVAGSRIYPGVQAHFAGVYRDITEERPACILKLEGDRVTVSPLDRV